MRPGIESATRQPIVTLNRRRLPELRHEGGAYPLFLLPLIDIVNDTNFRKLPCTISINVHDRDSLGKGKLQKHTGLMGKISF